MIIPRTVVAYLISIATIHMSNQATPSRMTRETCPSRKRNRSSIYRKFWICCHHKVHTQRNSDEVEKSLILKYSQQNYTAHRANSRRNALRRAASSKTWIRKLRTTSKKGVYNWATICGRVQSYLGEPFANKKRNNSA